VCIDGAERTLSLDEDELHDTFLPLFAAIASHSAVAAQQGRRCVVGLCGPPGAGTTTLARVLERVLAEAAAAGAPQDARAAVELVEAKRYRLPGQGALDHRRLAADVRRLAARPAGEAGALLVEGGLLSPKTLSGDAGEWEWEWQNLRSQLDLTVFLHPPAQPPAPLRAPPDADPAAARVRKDASVVPPAPRPPQRRAPRRRRRLERRAARAQELTLEAGAGGRACFRPARVRVRQPRAPWLLALGLNPSFQKTLELPSLQARRAAPRPGRGLGGMAGRAPTARGAAGRGREPRGAQDGLDRRQGPARCPGAAAPAPPVEPFPAPAPAPPREGRGLRPAALLRALQKRAPPLPPPTLLPTTHPTVLTLRRRTAWRRGARAWCTFWGVGALRGARSTTRSPHGESSRPVCPPAPRARGGARAWRRRGS
jgi:hypothetical protein